jgi:uncharacterized protein YggU (UPF0235/DUF167 family)
VAFLADQLRVPRRAIHIAGGQRGRLKRLAIDGIDAADFERWRQLQSDP